MLGRNQALRRGRLEPLLLELVKLRSSQLNAGLTAWMCTATTLALSESEQRLDPLAAWRETSHFNSRGRAALAWCEAQTPLPQSGAPDQVFEELEREFVPEQRVLTNEIVAINGCNRLPSAFASLSASTSPRTAKS